MDIEMLIRKLSDELDLPEKVFKIPLSNDVHPFLQGKRHSLDHHMVIGYKFGRKTEAPVPFESISLYISTSKRNAFLITLNNILEELGEEGITKSGEDGYFNQKNARFLFLHGVQTSDSFRLDISKPN